MRHLAGPLGEMKRERQHLIFMGCDSAARRHVFFAFKVLNDDHNIEIRVLIGIQTILFCTRRPSQCLSYSLFSGFWTRVKDGGRGV